MTILTLGVAAVFFAVGLILAWSKSAKGSVVLTLFIGFFSGGGIVFGSSHSSIGSLQLDATSIGWLLLAMGGGVAAGLIFGMVWKLRAQKNNQKIEIGMVQPGLDPKDRLPLKNSERGQVAEHDEGHH